MEYELYESECLGNAYGNLHILSYKGKCYMSVLCSSVGFKWIEINPSFFKLCLKNKQLNITRDYIIEKENEDFHYKYKIFIKSLRELNEGKSNESK